MFLTARVFFSALVPGFVWLFVFSLWDGASMARFLHALVALPAGVALAVSVLLVCASIIGFVGAQLSINCVEMVGYVVDEITSRIARNRIGFRIIRILSDALHVCSEQTIMQEIKRRAEEQPGLLLPISPQDRGRHAWGQYKLFILHHSAPMGEQLAEREAHINLYGGLALPICAFGLAVRHAFPVLGGLAIALAIYCVLRFH